MVLLDGLRVVDLGRWHAGPYCAKLMADAGAEVIHVEHPDGDPCRYRKDDDGAAFAFLNAGKQAVTLDFSKPAGADLLSRLLEKADVLVENFRPGTLERYGFGRERLDAINPALVHVSITNYGQTGPWRDREATELTLQAASGLMDGNGDLGREPLKYPFNLAQHWAGANAAYAALVAIWHALGTGKGQLVDVSIQESLANTWYSVYADYQYTGALQARGQRDLLPAADGQVMLRWQTSVPWDSFALALEADELLVEEGLQPPLIVSTNSERYFDVLASKTQVRTRRQWMDVSLEHEIPAGMLQDLGEIRDCEHLEARRFWDVLARESGSKVKLPGRFYWIDGAPLDARNLRAPSIGQDNAPVWGSLGVGAEELSLLSADGVI